MKKGTITILKADHNPYLVGTTIYSEDINEALDAVLDHGIEVTDLEKYITIYGYTVEEMENVIEKFWLNKVASEPIDDEEIKRFEFIIEMNRDALESYPEGEEIRTCPKCYRPLKYDSINYNEGFHIDGC